jgi:hypothetical protein
MSVYLADDIVHPFADNGAEVGNIPVAFKQQIKDIVNEGLVLGIR